jgi:hypothetical protein
MIVDNLILPATSTPEKYQLGLRLAEKLSAARPEDRPRRLQIAIAYYRLGNYGEALPLLEIWQRKRERVVVGQVGQFFMRTWPTPFLVPKPIAKDEVRALAFLAMTHHRLGQFNLARAGLADLRNLGSSPMPQPMNPEASGGAAWNRDEEYAKLLREAETLIEGKPQPGR